MPPLLESFEIRGLERVHVKDQDRSQPVTHVDESEGGSKVLHHRHLARFAVELFLDPLLSRHVPRIDDHPTLESADHRVIKWRAVIGSSQRNRMHERCTGTRASHNT